MAVVNEDKASTDVTSLIHGINVVSVQCPLHTPEYHSMTVLFIFNKCVYIMRRDGVF